MSRPSFSLIAFYVTSLGSLGCVPYFAVSLSEAGLPAHLVPMALATIPIGVLVGGPLWTSVSDATGSPTRVLRLATALSAGAGGLLFVSRSGLALAVSLLLWSLTRAPHMPIADAITLRALGGDRRSYGVVRAWGSCAFLIVAWLGGLLRDVWAPGPLALSWGLLALTAALAWMIPLGSAAALPRARTREVVDLVVQLLPFLVVAILHGATLVCFDSFWSMHVRELSLPSWVAGTGVACSVIVEVCVMIAGRTLLDRLGPTRLLATALLVGVPHWLLTAAVDEPAALIVIQSLRGVAFGAFWIAGVTLLSERAPPQLNASAQALLPASAFGIGYLACMVIAGFTLENHTTNELFRLTAILDGVAALVLFFAVWIEPTRR